MLGISHGNGRHVLSLMAALVTGVLLLSLTGPALADGKVTNAYKPKLATLSVSAKTVKRGKTVTYSIVIPGKPSTVSFALQCTYSGKTQHRLVNLKRSGSSSTYKGSLKAIQGMAPGSWKILAINCTGNKGIYSLANSKVDKNSVGPRANLSAANVKVTGTKMDVTGPTLTTPSLKAASSKVELGKTCKVTLTAKDNLSGIKAVALVYEGLNGYDEYLKASKGSGSTWVLNLNPKSLSKAVGTYKLKAVQLTDKMDNMTSYVDKRFKSSGTDFPNYRFADLSKADVTATSKLAYTVNFAANGGTGTMAAQKLMPGVRTALRANAFARSGYVFRGWAKTKTGAVAHSDKAKVIDVTTPGQKVTLYAVWRKAKTYTVKFSANGGTGSMGAQKITYNTSTALSANAFTRLNYSFAGWNTQANGRGTTYKNKAGVRNLAAEGKIVTLYAQWKATHYTIKFNANGGTGSMAAQTLSASAQAPKLRACSFTRKGYRFLGWRFSFNMGSGDDEEIDVRDQGNPSWFVDAGATYTVYAIWEDISYTVEFDANGGSGTMAAAKAYLGTPYKVPACAFTRDKCRFVGWSLDGSSDTRLQPGSTLPQDEVYAGGLVTLTAVWEYQHSIEFRRSQYGSRIDSLTGAAFVGQQLVIPELPADVEAPKGSTFLGWTLWSHADRLLTPGTKLLITAELENQMVFYPSWSEPDDDLDSQSMDEDAPEPEELEEPAEEQEMLAVEE